MAGVHCVCLSPQRCNRRLRGHREHCGRRHTRVMRGKISRSEELGCRLMIFGKLRGELFDLNILGGGGICVKNVLLLNLLHYYSWLLCYFV